MNQLIKRRIDPMLSGINNTRAVLNLLRDIHE